MAGTLNLPVTNNLSQGKRKIKENTPDMTFHEMTPEDRVLTTVLYST